MGLKDFLSHSWTLFNRDPTKTKGFDLPRYEGGGNANRPDRVFLSSASHSTILAPLFVRIANDVAQHRLRHCKVDKEETFEEELTSNFNDALKFNPNLDQNPDAFVRDLVLTMLEEGCAAVVPTVTDVSLKHDNGFDIEEMRIGRIIHWYGTMIEVELWNPLTDSMERYTLPKKDVAIIENPFYASMNANNSTARRLAQKQLTVDKLDADVADTKKLNILIQLPYVISNAAQQRKADQRLKSITDQLKDSEFGIAYVDGSEKIVQLNRPLDNGIREEVQYLYKRLLDELGISQAIVDGTADDTAILNYLNSIVEPILSTIAAEMTRKFTTKAGRAKGQRVMYFRDIFKLVPINQLADTVDKLSRNEILTGNEIRGSLGYKPSKQSDADELRNKNVAKPVEKDPGKEEKPQNGSQLEKGDEEQ